MGVESLVLDHFVSEAAVKHHRTYVAAPFEDAHLVRDIHVRMRALGIEPTAQWVKGADGKENQAAFTDEQLRDFALGNDRDIMRSNAMLVIARPGVGGEQFAEVRYALMWGIQVYWVGRRILSAYREGVTICESVEDALGRMVGK